MAFNLADVLKDVPKSDTGREQIEYIRLDLIDEDPNNFYQLSDIDKLAANIELCGLQQPIRLRPIPGSDHYRIVSGHRRRKAVEMLAQENSERWSEVHCIIEADEASPALQQLRLIYANANTRTMTSAELSEQAVQVEKLLYQLKEDGYEFPGRMRDHVAQAVGSSKSKLARLKVIRDSLSSVWRPSYEIGDLSESTAYELAKISADLQDLLFTEKQRTGANLKYLYADDVKRYAERAAAVKNQTCQLSGCACENYENKVCKAAVADRYGWFHCSEKCCSDCPELLRCKKACPKFADKILKMKADAKAKASEEREAQRQKDLPIINQIDLLWRRFGIARELAEKSIDDVRAVLGWVLPVPKEVELLERGGAELFKRTKLPYCSYYDEVGRLIKLADLLDCSLDYLLCRTDVRELAQDSPAVSDLGTGEDPAVVSPSCGWYPVDVEPPIGVKLVLLDYHDFVDEGVYRGSGLYSGQIDEGEPIRAWSVIPTDKDLESALTESCRQATWRTGDPQEYGTYVAYVQLPGASKKMLRELLWTGDEWLLFGEKIDDDAIVCSWIAQPEEY